MNLTVSYMNTDGSPATGLTPVISGHTLDGALILSGETMTEVANGFYTYDFNGYLFTSEYVFTAYESTLDQYIHFSNDVDSQRSQGAIKQLLGLMQSNFIMSGQVFDGDDNLTAATIKTYPTKADADGDTNFNHEYSVSAVYSSGALTSYKVVEE